MKKAIGFILLVINISVLYFDIACYLLPRGICLPFFSHFITAVKRYEFVDDLLIKNGTCILLDLIAVLVFAIISRKKSNENSC